MSSDSDSETAAPQRRKVDLANCSIKTGKHVVATVAGGIREWLPIPENLPKHPTMVSA